MLEMINKTQLILKGLYDLLPNYKQPYMSAKYVMWISLTENWKWIISHCKSSLKGALFFFLYNLLRPLKLYKRDPVHVYYSAALQITHPSIDLYL